MTSAKELAEEVEIVICDDGSPSEANHVALSLQFGDQVRCLRNEINLGRSGTRNRLVNEASYDYIIFIDGDSRLLDPTTYLINYINSFSTHELVIGGTAYAEELPESTVHLHWDYGRQREVQSVEGRIQNPIRYFFTNNFCCKKSILTDTPFDESITRYGYEDSVWASVVTYRGVNIHHIDNNVIHIGLKSNIKFLQDANAGLLTLAEWHQNKAVQHIKILNYYRDCAGSIHGKLRLNIARFLTPITHLLLKNNIYYSLKTYDLYRLGKLHAFIQKNVNMHKFD